MVEGCNFGVVTLVQLTPEFELLTSICAVHELSATHCLLDSTFANF